VGPPFSSRRKNDEGLCFPKLRTWPNFICEACTVRAVIDRELTGLNDWKLMCFERMRLLDMVHYWAKDTHAKYQGKLNALRTFELDYAASGRFLRPSLLLKPPATTDIPLMWLQESYSLRRSNHKHDDDLRTLSNAVMRQFRSAMSQYQAWDLMVYQPGAVLFYAKNLIICQPCRVTDGLAHSLFSAGISARLGEQTRHSVALLDRHIRWMDRDLNQKYCSARTQSLQREYVLAGFGLLTF
jgi:hypothetical protein